MSGIDWDKLPEVLAEHGVSYGDWKECSCGYPNPGPKHLARAVRAWVEEQMTEEWGTSCRGHYYPFSSRRSAEQSLIEGETLARRLVTPWAPAEGGKDS